MRNFTQKLTALAAVGWLSLTTALAGEQFVPKEYSYKNVGMSSQSTINIPMTDLFIYPDGMDAHSKPRRSRGQGRIRIHGRKRSGPIQV